PPRQHDGKARRLARLGAADVAGERAFRGDIEGHLRARELVARGAEGSGEALHLAGDAAIVASLRGVDPPADFHGLERLAQRLGLGRWLRARARVAPLTWPARRPAE